MFNPLLGRQWLCDNVTLGLKRGLVCFPLFFLSSHPWLPISQLTGVLVQLRPINTLVQRKKKSEETDKKTNSEVGRTVVLCIFKENPS